MSTVSQKTRTKEHITITVILIFMAIIAITIHSNKEVNAQNQIEQNLD